MTQGDPMNSPALAVALAMAGGIVAQSVARHARLPGIVVLLLTGVLVGPDFANVVRPASLGAGLQALVGFAVAVILFEGGMNLHLSMFRHQGRAIQQLITVGALVTLGGGWLASWLFLDWDWRTALLFGTLVIVTGPTVITPMLRRLRVEHGVSSILEAEGVLIDAVGAIIAVVALEIVIGPPDATFLDGVLHILQRLSIGAAIGLAGGLLLVGLLRVRNLVPEGLENVFVLSLVFALFQESNALLPESGIAAVTVAGMIVGNIRHAVTEELAAFKEELTTLLIGMLFVLLAADVRLAEVQALGWPGVGVVLALMFIVRPANIAVGTWGTELSRNQRLFLGWIAPRGIVAAAVASFFSTELTKHGFETGKELRAMVFLVIAVTVLSSSLTGGLVARLLGVRRPENSGWIILGAHSLARSVGTLLASRGDAVTLIDTREDAVRAARETGLDAVLGDALHPSTLKEAHAEVRAGAIGLAPNNALNLLFAERCRPHTQPDKLLVVFDREPTTSERHKLDRLGADSAFGRPFSVPAWSGRFDEGHVVMERWRVAATGFAEDHDVPLDDVPSGLLLPLIVYRDGRIVPWSARLRPRAGDVLVLALDADRVDEAHVFLERDGFFRCRPDEQPA